jgi:hypothetical protein
VPVRHLLQHDRPSSHDAGLDGVPVGSYSEQAKRDDDPLIMSAAVEHVRANMARTGTAAERLVFVEGPVEQTIPATVPERIAVLRLHTDWYGPRGTSSSTSGCCWPSAACC